MSTFASPLASTLAQAAAAGILAGTVACAEPRVVSAPMSAGSASAEPFVMEAHDAGTARPKRAAKEPAGKGCCAGKNDCKGKSSCAQEGKHDCAGKNDCKGQGTQCPSVDLE